MANLLSDTINYVVPFCRYQRANIGTNNMPIIGIGCTVRNIILSAPFQWKWNRNTATPITLVAGQQDYSAVIADLGFIEKATVTDTDGKIYEIKEIYNSEPLAPSTTVGRPMALANQTGDATGYTFRLSPVPDKAYILNIVYQKVAVQFAAISDGWAPIPDYFSDVYNNLSLGYYMDSCQDPRGPQYISRGIAGLLARAQGLKDTDRLLFA